MKECKGVVDFTPRQIRVIKGTCLVMEAEEREQLRTLVNRYGLNAVVNELSIICFQSADTAPDSLAIRWRRDGQTLNTILLLLNN